MYKVFFRVVATNDVKVENFTTRATAQAFVDAAGDLIVLLNEIIQD